MTGGPNDRFPSGLLALSEQAGRRGMGFGVWCGWGNADPRSPVALEHPDWLATWRGHVPVLSFDNHGLCLGHDPARDWVLEELSRLVSDAGLTWLLHDFETIARCDSSRRTATTRGPASTPRRPRSTTSSAPSPPDFPRWCWRTAGTASGRSIWP